MSRQQDCIGQRCLDFGHRRTLTNATRASADATTALEASEDSGDDEGSEAKPEEGVTGLCLTATLFAVASATRDTVGCGVGVVGATVNAQLRGEGDGTGEPEDGVEGIESDGDGRVESRQLVRRRNGGAQRERDGTYCRPSEKVAGIK